MPTLSFWKKKRTKDLPNQIGPSISNVVSNQSSRSKTPTSSRCLNNSVASSSTHDTIPGQDKLDSTTDSQDTSVAISKLSSMTGIPQTLQTAGSHSHSTVNTQGNLPSIQNLINPPQNDAPAHTKAVVDSETRSGVVTYSTPHAQVNTPQIRQTKGKYSLSDFEILRTLGTGSFGRVHLVQSKHNNRFYAVKVMKKHQVVKMRQVEHTNDERAMLQEVKHPFLITLWGTFQDSKNLYMVMDFVEGGELFSLLRKSQV